MNTSKQVLTERPAWKASGATTSTCGGCTFGGSSRMTPGAASG